MILVTPIAPLPCSTYSNGLPTQVLHVLDQSATPVATVPRTRRSGAAISTQLPPVLHVPRMSWFNAFTSHSYELLLRPTAMALSVLDDFKHVRVWQSLFALHEFSVMFKIWG